MRASSFTRLAEIERHSTDCRTFAYPPTYQAQGGCVTDSAGKDNVTAEGEGKNLDLCFLAQTCAPVRVWR
jgi:hypothetical protein